MPTQKPRIALTVPDDLNDTLEELAELQDVPKTKIIVELLVEFQPFFEQSLELLKKIKVDKDNADNLTKSYVTETILKANLLIGDLAKGVSDK